MPLPRPLLRWEGDTPSSGGGHPLLTPHLPRRLRRLASSRAPSALDLPPNYNTWIRLCDRYLIILLRDSGTCVGTIVQS